MRRHACENSEGWWGMSTVLEWFVDAWQMARYSTWKFRLVHQLSRWIPAALGYMRRRNILSCWGGYDLCERYGNFICRVFDLNWYTSEETKRFISVFYGDPGLVFLPRGRRFALLRDDYED